MSDPTKQPKEKTKPKDKPKYETPRVVSLSDTPGSADGTSICGAGSGEAYGCYNGPTAGVTCSQGSSGPGGP